MWFGALERSTARRRNSQAAPHRSRSCTSSDAMSRENRGTALLPLFSLREKQPQRTRRAPFNLKSKKTLRTRSGCAFRCLSKTRACPRCKLQSMDAVGFFICIQNLITTWATPSPHFFPRTLMRPWNLKFHGASFAWERIQSRCKLSQPPEKACPMRGSITTRSNLTACKRNPRKSRRKPSRQFFTSVEAKRFGNRLPFLCDTLNVRVPAAWILKLRANTTSKHCVAIKNSERNVFWSRCPNFLSALHLKFK